MTRFLLLFFSLGCLFGAASLGAAELLRVGVFRVDATPPIGAPLAYDPHTWVDRPLSARGIVLLGSGKPIVLCAVDWIGIGNGGQDAWKQGISEALGTDAERVAVHTLHQHDAPSCDFTALGLIQKAGIGAWPFDPVFARRVIADVAAAARDASLNAVSVTHVGVGSAVVERIASNRRILGNIGTVVATRWTATRDPALRAAGVGQIDPKMRLISFWSEEKPIVALTYYATHPQSHYRTGGANPDFPGLARSMRESETGGVPHIHFNGAGGDIGAGKWNDGAPENRVVLAVRLADGARRAWENTVKTPIHRAAVDWRVVPVALPRSDRLGITALRSALNDSERPLTERHEAAHHLAWAERTASGHSIPVTRLRIGPADIVHLPGEAVISYQLEAQSMASDRFVAVAAYGDYGPGYICRAAQYVQGGYEASPRASRVAAHTETILLPALREALRIVQSPTTP